MTPAIDPLSSLAGRASDTFAAALEFAGDTSAQCKALVNALRNLWPNAGGWGVALRDAAGLHVSAVDGAGQRWTELEATLADEGSPAPGATPVIVESLCLQRREWGRMAIASSDPQVRPFVAAAAPLLATHLALARGRADLDAESIRADIGELAGPLMHEVTNAFNNLQLNLMVLEQGAADLASINFGRLRSRMDYVTALVREVQEYRRTSPAPREPVDVNAAAEESLAGLRREEAEASAAPFAVETDWAAALPPIHGARTDAVRCFALLFRNGLKAARGAGAAWRVGTGTSHGIAVLHIQIPGLIVPVESPSRLYDTLAAVCPQMSALELATAKSIARRFDARVSADCPAAGLTLRVDFAKS